jgi:hypothetical protein
MIYGFAAADGYEVCLERPRLFAAELSQSREDGIFFVADKILQIQDRRLDLLNVKYLVVPRTGAEFDQFSAHEDRFAKVFDDGHVSVFENKWVLPRAFIVPSSGVEVIPDTAEKLTRLKDPSFNPERAVVLSAPLAGLAEHDAGPLPANDAVVVERQGINEYRFRVETGESGVLVLSQVHYPGWRATLDGERVPVLDANYAFSGIPVPAGSHEVRFIFDPWSFKAGVAITILSIVMASALTASAVRRP